jgi:hypothetical protein
MMAAAESSDLTWDSFAESNVVDERDLGQYEKWRSELDNDKDQIGRAEKQYYGIRRKVSEDQRQLQHGLEQLMNASSIKTPLPR